MNKDLFSKIIKYCWENRTLVVSSVLSVILLTITICRFWPSSNQDAPKKVEELFSRFEKKGDEKILKQLTTILDKHPYLRLDYGDKIVEKLLTDGKEPPSSLLSKEHTSPYLAKFSSVSLLIAKNELEKALGETIALQDTMLKDPSLQKSSFLFALNLVRIANLQQALKHSQEELLAWKKVEELMKKDHDIALRLESSFQTNNINLKDYIMHRKDQLVSMR